MYSNIRQATANDLIKLQKISREVIQENYMSFLGESAVNEFINSGMEDSYIAEMLPNATLILIDDEIAGMCICKNNVIDLVMVANKFQRQGIGTILINHALKELFEKYDEVCLESFEDNDKANAFYDNSGWERVKVALDEAFGINKIYYRRLKN